MKNRKTLLIIILVIIVVGISTYLYAPGGGLFDEMKMSDEAKKEIEVKEFRQLFPDVIGPYHLYGVTADKVEVFNNCRKIEDHADAKDLGVKGEVCIKTVTGQYQNATTSTGVFVHLYKATKGKDVYMSAIEKSTTPEKLGAYDIRRAEPQEIGWKPATDFDFAFTQQGLYRFNEGRLEYAYLGIAKGDNVVTQYFLNKFPPVKK